MSLPLPTHPDYTFSALKTPSTWQELEPWLNRPEFYMPALTMLAAPSPQSFQRAIAAKEIALWRMDHISGGAAGVAIYNTTTTVDSVYVHTQRGFEPEVAQAGLTALIQVLYSHKPGCQDIITAVSLPEHSEAEMVLALLGFEQAGARAEFEAVQQLYWLRRSIWEAYAKVGL